MTPNFQFGPRLESGATRLRLWAPAARKVELLLDRAHPMPAAGDGWYEIAIPGIGAGTRYRFRIDGEVDVPDPASSFQPQDIAGPSEVINHDAYPWQATDWRGRPWRETVILELHIGTFTLAGTFRAAIDKLDHLVSIGVTAIELMPVADFAGRHNWGYDGVLLYAPDNAYGRPDDLRALIDAAHQRGLMVFLDVVYNHFGPEGNYLGRYAPTFFVPVQTPWGQAIDYQIPPVRAFAVENALHWLSRYRFDGLRLDAVHALIEPGRNLLLGELSVAVGAYARATGRTIHLMVENDRNEARILDPLTDPPAGKYRAQWNDDYHHAWHVLLTGERGGYYQDYAGDATARIARILSAGFDYQGEPSAHRAGARRGEPSAGLPPGAFINFIQNHDQIGNRPLGDRLDTLAPTSLIEAALAILLLAPMPPLLFMGEEWGSKAPFPFFCDFTGPLADAVRKGRRAEFKSAYETFGDRIPDPLSPDTFRSAVLDWTTLAKPEALRRMALVRALLATRHEWITSFLGQTAFGSARMRDGVLTAKWPRGNVGDLELLANLSDGALSRPAMRPARSIWGGEPPPTLPLWSVYWSIGEP